MFCGCFCFSLDRNHMRLRHGAWLEKTVIVLVVVISKAARVVFGPEVAIRWHLLCNWQNCNVFLFIPVTLLFLWFCCGFGCGEEVRALVCCVIDQKCIRAAFVSCLVQLFDDL